MKRCKIGCKIGCKDKGEGSEDLACKDSNS